MRDKVETVYTFDELSDRAKERARDWWRESLAGDNFFAESVIEDAARMADLMGINLRSRTARLMGGGTRQEPEIYWSGFLSQGDGACFVGSYAYRKGSAQDIAKEAPTGDGKEWAGNNEINRIARGLADIQRRHFYRLTANVAHTGRYSHKHATTIDVYNGDDEADTDTAEAVSDLLRDFMRWIYRALEREYEYQMSNATVNENIRANEYEFDEDGRPS